MTASLHGRSHQLLAVDVRHPPLLTQTGGQLLQVRLASLQQLTGSEEVQLDPGQLPSATAGRAWLSSQWTCSIPFSFRRGAGPSRGPGLAGHPGPHRSVVPESAPRRSSPRPAPLLRLDPEQAAVLTGVERFADAGDAVALVSFWGDSLPLGSAIYELGSCDAMQWGEWELVVDVDPPILRNNNCVGIYDVILDDSGGYWGMLGMVLDIYNDSEDDRSCGINTKTDQVLLAALNAIFRHALDRGRTMTPAEAAYSYAAAHGNLPVFTDEIARELRLHTGIDRPPTTTAEALQVLVFGMRERGHGELIDGVDLQADAAALQRVWRVRARQLHPDAGGSEAAFKALQVAYMMLRSKDRR